MLLKITTREAFEMLMDKEKYMKVYFKHSGDYLLAKAYKWEFTHNDAFPKPITNFATVNFYKEVED